MEILSQLTVVGKVTKEDFERRFDEMFPSHSHIYKIVVIIDNKIDKVIGSGTIFTEKKFLR
jgi:glucosamine-phosphate N-acetyltransferase